jgi:hypothetical protein
MMDELGEHGLILHLRMNVEEMRTGSIQSLSRPWFTYDLRSSKETSNLVKIHWK